MLGVNTLIGAIDAPATGDAVSRRSHPVNLDSTESTGRGGQHAEPCGGARDYSRARNSSSLSPASRTIPPMVKALIGLCLGTVMIRMLSVITIRPSREHERRLDG